jgi:hypothetical protein
MVSGAKSCRLSCNPRAGTTEMPSLRQCSASKGSYSYWMHPTGCQAPIAPTGAPAGKDPGPGARTAAPQYRLHLDCRYQFTILWLDLALGSQRPVTLFSAWRHRRPIPSAGPTTFDKCQRPHGRRIPPGPPSGSAVGICRRGMPSDSPRSGSFARRPEPQEMTASSVNPNVFKGRLRDWLSEFSYPHPSSSSRRSYSAIMFGNIEEKEAQHHTEGGMGAVGDQLEYSDGIDNVSKDLPEEGALAVRRMTPTEKAEALAMAQVVDSGVSYRSLRGMTLLAIMFSCLICGTDVAIDANGA